MAEPLVATSVFDRLLKDRIIWLGSEVRDDNANEICAKILLLAAEDPEKDIYLYINSPGGSMSAMLAVYDTMQYLSSPVATTCVGQAASAAAVLLAGGAPGRRSILEHGRVVLHQPAASSRGAIPDLILEADEVIRVRGQLEEVLARHTGKEPETLRRDTDRDLVLPAQRAVEYGIVDQVVSSVARR